MLLFSDGIRFMNQCAKRGIDVVDIVQTERMNDIARRDLLYRSKEPVRRMSRKYEMSIEPLLSGHRYGKTHPYLKRDPGLLRNNDDRTVLFYRAAQRIKENANGRSLPGEMRGKLIRAASV
jgi:hypothetical protein